MSDTLLPASSVAWYPAQPSDHSPPDSEVRRCRAALIRILALLCSHWVGKLEMTVNCCPIDSWLRILRKMFYTNQAPSLVVSKR
jgi:hypothetical protein